MTARWRPYGAWDTRSLTMLQSLRARLAFLFLGTLVLATVIASVVVVSLYQSYNRNQTEEALRKQVEGVASYYQAGRSAAHITEGHEAGPRRDHRQRVRARQRRSLYYAGPDARFRAAGAARLSGRASTRILTDADARRRGRCSSSRHRAGRTYIGVGGADLQRRPGHRRRRARQAAGRREQRLEERDRPRRGGCRRRARRRRHPGHVRRPPHHPAAAGDRAAPPTRSPAATWT